MIPKNITIPENRMDALELFIGLVQSVHGSPGTYEELLNWLTEDFSEMNFTMDEVVEHYTLVREIEDLHIQLRVNGFSD